MAQLLIMLPLPTLHCFLHAKKCIVHVKNTTHILRQHFIELFALVVWSGARTRSRIRLQGLSRTGGRHGTGKNTAGPQQAHATKQISACQHEKD